MGWDSWHWEWVFLRVPPQWSLSGNTLIDTPKGVFQMIPNPVILQRIMNITYRKWCGSGSWILQLNQISCFSCKYLVFLLLVHYLQATLLLLSERLEEFVGLPFCFVSLEWQRGFLTYSLHEHLERTACTLKAATTLRAKKHFTLQAFPTLYLPDLAHISSE